MKQATQKEILERIRVEAAENYYKKTGYVPTEWAVMNFIAGFDKGAEEMAKIKDAQIEGLVEALENIASEYSEDIFDEGYNPHQNPAFTMANKALENFRKEVK